MKFRKKPVVIEAHRWDGDNARELQAWAHKDLDPMMNAIILFDGYSLRVRTLEGVMYANIGDMIIRGVQGEFYACKPDIFDATYEPAEMLEIPLSPIPLPVLPGWCPQCHTREASKHHLPYCSSICREEAERRESDPRRI